ncbi:FUSC family protein [Metapseudomonas resinovorans]|uniref:Putative ArAE family transporter n=1 Tax=Metapseudomonas resinovorans NBRC 106553 TaxID=1245471 RepID=S6AHB1_METRE|nr:putative ArAE family transporter [Pseudomonas resinovorans NBRC 106553]
MRDNLRAFLAPDMLALQFAIKTLLGGGLALWLAYRFDLQQPQWALMTAFIVAQPLSGMVVQKGLARLLGTLVGTAMSVLIMALFAQTPWLFLLALALWLGFCTAASTMMRSAWSYAFVLAGYTVAIIGLPAIAHPLAVFDQAVARSTEICLGILCATLTSALLWPQRVELQLARQARDTWECGVQAAISALKGERQERQGLLGVLGRIVAVDAQREHAWFEGSRGRQRAVALQALSHDLLSLLRLARGVARQWLQLSEGEAQVLRPWLEELEQALVEPDVAHLDTLRERLLVASENDALSTIQQYCLVRMAVLARQAAAAVVAMHGVERGEAPADAPPPLSAHRDVQTAAIYGLRSSLAFLGLSAFWLATAWTSAVGALTLTCVICGLFASRENAEQIGMLFLRGILYALPVAFFVGQVLLPQLSGFAMLCMALGVPLFFGALGMARPAIGATATSFCLHFIVLCAPLNVMRFDVGLFLNEAVSMLLGVGFAVYVFRLIPLRNPVWHGRRLLKASLNDLARLTGVRLAGAENWFGGRMADRLMQLARFYPVLPEQSRSRWDDGLASLDLGDELLHLRRCLAAADRPLGVSEDRFLRELERTLLQGPAPGRAQALDSAVGELLTALRAAGRSVDRRLAQAALLQLQQSWRQWCEQQETSHGLA